MFQKKQRDTPYLNDAIEMAVRNLDPNDKDYLQKVEGVERLMCLKEQSNRRISPDTQAIVIANLVGIVLILNYEHFHPIASKAMSSLLKLK